MEKIKQKWINEGEVSYPTYVYPTLSDKLGKAVFSVHFDPLTHRIGLAKLADSFTFDFKLYDLGCDDVFNKIVKTWNSEQFISSSKNLGVIFNGLKGTGKTVAAKVISNMINLPVVIVPQAFDGIQDFIASLDFVCVVLIDEAEKTFKNNQECLLKLIDGVHNKARKLYIMTTNNLYLDENLIGRPGRVRYIHTFQNLSAKAVNDYIDDNLYDKSNKGKILEFIDSLEISTIDILKVIVEETNIYGEVPSDELLNVPRANYHFSVMQFYRLSDTREKELNEFIRNSLKKGETLKEWLDKSSHQDEDYDTLTNQGRIEEKFNCACYTQDIAIGCSSLHKGQLTRWGTIIDEPDNNGWFHMKSDNDDEAIGYFCILNCSEPPSLYKGELAF